MTYAQANTEVRRLRALGIMAVIVPAVKVNNPRGECMPAVITGPIQHFTVRQVRR